MKKFHRKKMIDLDPEKLIKELKKGLGDEDLTLVVACTKCNAQFELNHESVVIAIMNETPFIEYLRWIQNSKCKNCNEKND